MATSGCTSSDTCSICTEKFKNPKLLPCFHSFCLKCLEQFVSSSSKGCNFLCPVCRYEVTLPEEGVAGFQTNFYIEAREEKQLHDVGECCEMCEQRARASHTCRECEMLMCDACVNVHNNIPSTRSHMLINLTDSDSRKPVLSVQKFCEKHKDEKLRFYCKPCSKVICRDCKLTDHDGHKTKDISDVAAEARTSLMKTKVKLEKYNTEIDETLERVSCTSAVMSENIKTIKTEINSFFDSLVEMINKIRSQEINYVTATEEHHRMQYSNEQNNLKQRKSFLQSQIDHSDAMLKEGLDCDVITADDKMKQRLEEIEKEQSIGSDSGHQSVYIPPNPAANLGQMNVVRDDIHKILINAFSSSNKSVLLKTVKIIDAWNVHSISFTKSQKLLSVQGEVPFLRLYETSSSQPTDLFTVTLDELKKHGVHGLIKKHNKDNPENKIPTSDYTDLKKPFPYMDTNDDGDTCSVDNKNNMVIIKPVNGVVRALTLNPFAEVLQEFEPVDVCWGNNKEVYIADRGTDVIAVYSLRDGFQKSLKNPSEYRLTAIAMGRDGKLWVGDDCRTINICDVE